MIAQTPWIVDRSPTVAELPVWAVRNGVVDIYFYCLPVAPEAWMPAYVPVWPVPDDKGAA